MTSLEESVLVALATLVVFAVIFVVLLGWSRRRQRVAGTGEAQWRQVAEKLPFRDRVAIERAVSGGRCAPHGYQALAVQRAQVALAVGERLQSPRWRIYRSVLTGGCALLLVVGILQLSLIGWRHWPLWLEVACCGTGVVYSASWSTLQRRHLTRARQSLEVNTALGRAAPLG